MLVAIKFGTLVRLMATVLVVSFILFVSLTYNSGSTQDPTPPPQEPLPTKQV
jgi:hypothetical protein